MSDYNDSVVKFSDLFFRGHNYCQQWKPISRKQSLSVFSEEERLGDPPNPLKSYFDSHLEGRGIWKWNHYFDIYHRHFSKFREREVHVLEVGIYSGGSLSMWKNYFGQGCYIYGVDIEEACRVYEDDRTKIFVGDQADRKFWDRFKEEVPFIDIVIDDGGHKTEQQIVTLEETLPHIHSGGVYLCEDIHGDLNGFNFYVFGLASHLNSFAIIESDQKTTLASRSTPFQAAIQSMHLYPYITVIEKANNGIDEFVAPKHGTEWQPFLGPI